MYFHLPSFSIGMFWLRTGKMYHASNFKLVEDTAKIHVDYGRFRFLFGFFVEPLF